MAVVKTWTTQLGGKECKIKVNFSARSEKFTIKFPAPMAERLQEQDVESDSLAGVESLWEKALQRYESARTTVSKVIRYRVQLSGLADQRDNHFSRGLEISIQAAVFEATRVANEGEGSRVRYRVLPSSIPAAMVEYNHGSGTDRNLVDIPWSQQAEDFFASVGAGMLDLMGKLKQLQDMSTLQQVIEQGGLMLLGGEVRTTDSRYEPALRDLLRRLQAGGYKLLYTDTREDGGFVDADNDPEKVVQGILGVDQGTITVKHPEEQSEKGILIVLGNEICEMVSDYHVSDLLDQIISEHYERWDQG